MGRTRIFGDKCKQNNQSTSETRKEEQSFMYGIHCLELLHIPIQSNEIQESYQIMGCTQIKTTQNKH